MSPTSGLRFELDVEQTTPHEPRRIIRENGRYYHRAKLDTTWADIAEFTMEAMPAIDREVGNWYTSMHPQSHFKSRLMVACATNDRRVTILNREFTLRRGMEAETLSIQSPGQLLQLPDRHFGLKFPAGTRFECPALDF